MSNLGSKPGDFNWFEKCRHVDFFFAKKKTLFNSSSFSNPWLGSNAIKIYIHAKVLLWVERGRLVSRGWLIYFMRCCFTVPQSSPTPKKYHRKKKEPINRKANKASEGMNWRWIIRLQSSKTVSPKKCQQKYAPQECRALRRLSSHVLLQNVYSVGAKAAKGEEMFRQTTEKAFVLFLVLFLYYSCGGFSFHNFCREILVNLSKALRMFLLYCSSAEKWGRFAEIYWNVRKYVAMGVGIFLLWGESAWIFLEKMLFWCSWPRKLGV